MQHETIEVRTTDGICRTHLFEPDKSGQHPGARHAARTVRHGRTTRGRRLLRDTDLRYFQAPIRRHRPFVSASSCSTPYIIASYARIAPVPSRTS
ncbi:hypothetical protein BH11GEM1_BH11GEM1_05100 [soil metagenome]